MVNNDIEELLGSPSEQAQMKVGQAFKFSRLAALALAAPEPQFQDWFLRDQYSLDRAMSWARAGWSDEAWLFLQLRYDQLFKDGLQRGRRHDLGAHLCDLSILAWSMNHFAAARHYAALGLIGDLFAKVDDGLAGPLLANQTSRKDSEDLRRYAGDTIASRAWPKDWCLCPEALLAARWFGKKGDQLLDRTKALSGTPFVHRLLDELEAPHPLLNTTTVGTLLEAAAGLVLAGTPGFEVRGTTQDSAAQTDLLVVYRKDFFVNAAIPEGYALVECKATAKTIDSSTVRELGARCTVLGAKVGIFVSLEPLTGARNARLPFGFAELERRRFLPHGVHILMVSAEELRGAARELRGLEPVLREDFERLSFGEPPSTEGV